MRSFLRATLVVIPVLLGGTAPRLGAQAAMAMTASGPVPEKPYARIGDDDHRGPRRCFSHNVPLLPWAIGLKRCPTYPGVSLSRVGMQDDRDVLSRMERAKWNAWSDSTRREPLLAEPDKSKWPVQRIRVMPRPSHFKFSAINNDGIVFAQILADPKGPRDKRFGIGELKGNFENTFYLAAAGYDAIDNADTLLSGTKVYSRKVSNWYVYGVERQPDQTRRLVRVGNTGTFRWCGFGHVKEQKDETAKFIDCKAYHSLLMFLSDKDNAVLTALKGQYPARRYDMTWLLHAITRATSAPASLAGATVVLTPEVLTGWRTILDGFEASPGWMPCGAGCCTADSY